jgi:hypothetical protein
MSTKDVTPPPAPKFDFDAYPPDSLFHDRRSGIDRRDKEPARAKDTSTPGVHPERRARTERRRRIDPTTFEKQYTTDELEFMNAVQQFKVQSGKPFPSFREVIKVAVALGYRKVIHADSELMSADLTA